MKQVIFIVGGCRSGKSRHALELGETYMGGKNCFVATCKADDREMKERVRRHRAERDPWWSTVETPVDLTDTLLRLGRSADVILVDCLTLWVNNLLMQEMGDDMIMERIDLLTGALETVKCPVILVSNEVGAGIVPENRLARRFRDLAGFANQRVAGCSDRVVWMMAGIPVQIK